MTTGNRGQKRSTAQLSGWDKAFKLANHQPRNHKARSEKIDTTAVLAELSIQVCSPSHGNVEIALTRGNAACNASRLVKEFHVNFFHANIDLLALLFVQRLGKTGIVPKCPWRMQSAKTYVHT